MIHPVERDGRTLRRDAAGEPLPHGDADTTFHLFFDALGGSSDELVPRLVEEEDRRRVRVEDLADTEEQFVEQILDGEDSRERGVAHALDALESFQRVEPGRLLHFHLSTVRRVGPSSNVGGVRPWTSLRRSRGAGASDPARPLSSCSPCILEGQPGARDGSFTVCETSDLRRARQRRHPGADRHGDAGVLPVHDLAFPRVDPGAHLDPRARGRARRSRGRTGCAGRSVERRVKPSPAVSFSTPRHR